MDNTKEHQKLVDDILFAVGSMPNIRIWQRVVGFDHLKKIRYNTPGESDLQGIISPGGRMLAIECKTGKGKLESDQIRWRDMIIKFGGLYIEGRSIEQVIDELKRSL